MFDRISPVYDAMNRVTLSVDAMGGATQTEYDALGNAIQVTRYAGAVSLSGVTAQNAATLLPGRVQADANHDRVTRNQFDIVGRLVATMQVNMIEVLDYSGRYIDHIEARGFVTTTTYSTFGEVYQTTQYDLPIPGESYTFATLRDAQALGDLQVLRRRGRRALRVALGADADAGLAALLASIQTR